MISVPLKSLKVTGRYVSIKAQNEQPLELGERDQVLCLPVSKEKAFCAIKTPVETEDYAEEEYEEYTEDDSMSETYG